MNNDVWGNETTLGHFSLQNAIGIAAAIRDLEYYKNVYDKVLLHRNFEEIKHIVIILDNIPPVLGTGFYFPAIDLEGTRVNNLDDPCIVPDGLAISCIGCPSNNTGVIILSATENSYPLLENYFYYLSKKDGGEILEVIIKLLFLYEENIVFSPDWWMTLPLNIQSSFRTLITSNLPFQQRMELDEFNLNLFENFKLVEIKLL